LKKKDSGQNIKSQGKKQKKGAKVIFLGKTWGARRPRITSEPETRREKPTNLKTHHDWKHQKRKEEVSTG